MTDSNTYMVANLLEKMTSTDRDFRYMALNDLMNELQKQSFTRDPVVETKVVEAVLRLMGDKNTEVQNLAVKCLGPLVKQIKPEHIGKIIKTLCDFMSQQKNVELRGIASIGLKSVVQEVQSQHGKLVASTIIPEFLQIMNNEKTEYETQLDVLDILGDVVHRFGAQLTAEEQQTIQQALLPRLSHSRATIRKRSVMALGHLVAHVSDALFDATLKFILDGLNSQIFSGDKLRTFVQCTGVLGRYSGIRLGKYLSHIIPIVTEYTKKADEDDELREICLQTLESFVLRCPTDIAPFINNIVDLGLTYLSYDNNMGDMDDDDEDMENQDEDDDEYDDIVDFSDDDDMSWKVRRSASKLLSSIIETHADLLAQMYEHVAPALIRRFSEREESVRVDVLRTFIALLAQTSVYRGGELEVSTDQYDLEFDVSGCGEEAVLKPTRRDGSAMDASSDTDIPAQKLAEQVPALCKALAKQLAGKSVQTRQVGFQLLRMAIAVLQGGLDKEITQFMPAIEVSLISSTADPHQSLSSNLKIEVLAFLRALFHYHDADVTRPYLASLCPIVTQMLSDAYYKTVSESLLVCIEIIKVIRPISTAKTPLDQASIDALQNLYERTLQLLSTNNADQEVKERSIMVLGALLAQVPDALASKQAEAWQMLLDRLKNEVTRLISVRTLAIVSQSPLAAGPELEQSVLLAVDDIALLLRKSNRSLRIASLECLNILVQRFGTAISEEHYQRFLNEVRPLLSDVDLHLLPLALKLTESIIVIHPSSTEHVNAVILPGLFQLIQSPLLQGAALKQLLLLFAALGKASPQDYDAFIRGLIDPLRQPSTAPSNGAAVPNKQCASTAAQCVAVLAAQTDPERCLPTVREFQSELTKPDTTDASRYLSLLTLGEIGHRLDLSQLGDIYDQVLQLFSSSSEEVKFAAAFALGSLTVGNLRTYLPLLVTQIKTDTKRRFLLFHALKEVITRCNYQSSMSNLADASGEIWILLLASSEEDHEEGTRSVVGECLGKLALTNTAKYLPQLETGLGSSSAPLRATVATAFKYIVVDPSQDSDNLLKPIIDRFLTLLEDVDINVRRLALLTINSALHRKPYLVRDVLDTLLPLLYQETIVKEELIHMVEMGPFKHKVDDGLEIRKAAYECLYSLLSTCLDKIDIHGYITSVQIGLEDQHEIKMLVYLMLIRLGKVAPTAVCQKLDDFVAPMKATLDTKLRNNAVKQEMEKNQEVVRATLRCITSLSNVADTGNSPKFKEFIEAVKLGPLGADYKATIEETDKRESRPGDLMDLSA
ncbi:TIP120-domain-containing protein [Hesseltinella vesiculosa]|uniref:TIP120-domain-containing protein n=1 Tax=Hesseltinella vesiculosa TaxID=101127 RepID=A0A1X2GTL9_9FUNG|nr:TIP120-domain-containing protein [Hesseltinella vesiculosa]